MKRETEMREATNRRSAKQEKWNEWNGKEEWMKRKSSGSKWKSKAGKTALGREIKQARLTRA